MLKCWKATGFCGIYEDSCRNGHVFLIGTDIIGYYLFLQTIIIRGPAVNWVLAFIYENKYVRIFLCHDTKPNLGLSMLNTHYHSGYLDFLC